MGVQAKSLSLTLMVLLIQMVWSTARPKSPNNKHYIYDKKSGHADEMIKTKFSHYHTYGVIDS